MNNNNFNQETLDKYAKLYDKMTLTQKKIYDNADRKFRWAGNLVCEFNLADGLTHQFIMFTNRESYEHECELNVFTELVTPLYIYGAEEEA